MSKRRRTIVCADCGHGMVLRRSAHGPFYGCSRFPDCRATHGAHPDGQPLGVPGTRATKDARISAHAVFDRLWENGQMSRSQAYAWMRDATGFSHIARLDESQCAELIRAIEARGT